MHINFISKTLRQLKKIISKVRLAWLRLAKTKIKGAAPFSWTTLEKSFYRQKATATINSPQRFNYARIFSWWASAWRVEVAAKLIWVFLFQVKRTELGASEGGFSNKSHKLWQSIEKEQTHSYFELIFLIIPILLFYYKLLFYKIIILLEEIPGLKFIILEHFWFKKKCLQ